MSRLLQETTDSVLMETGDGILLDGYVISPRWTNETRSTTTFSNQTKNTYEYTMNTEDDFALLGEDGFTVLREYDSSDWYNGGRNASSWSNVTKY